MNNVVEEIRKHTTCDIKTDAKTRKKFSKDTSLFQIMPQAVAFPKDAREMGELVKTIQALKEEGVGDISLTGRSGGSDMTGGPLTQSVVVSTTEYMNHFEINEGDQSVTVEPGVFYRDFEKEGDGVNLLYPAYPASKSLCAWGGMVMNNCAGEKTLRYGQTREHVKELSMILSDGNEYVFKALNETELHDKMNRNNFEGDLYRKIYDLVDENYSLIQKHKPQTSKNSSGYALWRVWDREKKIFDMTQLFVGSQGTLGLMARAKMKLIPESKHEGMVALFLPSWDRLPNLVNKILPFSPESLETFDDATMKLGIRFMPEIAKKVGSPLFGFLLKFVPEAIISLRMFSIPKLVILVELVEKDEETLNTKIKDIEGILKKEHVLFRTLRKEKEREKYWIMRRESFSLLRKKVNDKRTAPFIEDFCVLPEDIPQFLPELLAILKDAGIEANIAGHAGNGNFHIIPLMNLDDPEEREKIIPVADKVYDLIISYGGTITAEHNDGIIRTPYVRKQFGDEMYKLFEEVKHIFDPENIFNPGKKVGGTKEDIKKYLY